MRKIIFRIITVLLISVMAVSCSKAHDYFYGGEILDADKMESIRADIVSSEADDSKIEETESKKENSNNKQEETSKETSRETSKETNNNDENKNDVLEETTGNKIEGGEVVTDVTDEKDSQESTNISTETEKEDQNKVYWTESGGVWHLFEDCGHLKNSKDVIFGTEEEAIAAGKSKVCSSCNKKVN